ncbi:MAG: lipoate--protein ligase family protein [Planctomycetes bacterium]|nr:lipoate--protein ligase family protein [Planctomycetota bacterium]
MLPYAAADPAWNMAVDGALVHHATMPTLRLYGWDPPAVSLGRFQPGRAALGGLLNAGLPVVRRITGGGAIVHWHELTYSVTLPDEHPLVRCSTRESYAALHAPIKEALAALGVDASTRQESSEGPDPVLCFHRVTALDLVVGELKLVGSAQRRTQGRVLQHGSIVLAANPLQPGTAALDAILGRTVPPEDLTEAIARAFDGPLGGLERGELTPVERAAAEKAVPECRFS